MSTKKTFRIKFDAEFTIDFERWEFTDAQMQKESEFKRMIMNKYLDLCGFDEFEVLENKTISLFEAMGEMFNPNKK